MPNIIFVTAVFLAGCDQAAHASIWYVHQGAIGTASGDSWTNAYTDLHEALEVAKSGDAIWVGSGTYKPDRSTGDQTMVFELPCGVALYGGFAGWEECLEDRIRGQNETILSGDLNDDDGPQNCEEVSDCCRPHDTPGCDNAECEALVCAYDPLCCGPQNPDDYWDSNYWRDFCVVPASVVCCHLGAWGTCEDSDRVLTVAECNLVTTADGLVFVGAGYRDWISEPVLGYPAAALHCEPGVLDISNCSFRGKDTVGFFAERGSTVTFTDSLFERRATVRGSYSLPEWESTVTFERCTFESAVLEVATATTFLLDSNFTGYPAQASLAGDSLVESCLFQDGLGLTLSDGWQNVRNSFFLDNVNTLYFLSSVGTVDNSVFINNSTVQGGESSILFRNSMFEHNSPSALRWQDGNLYVLNCTIVGNGFEDWHSGAGIDLRLVVRHDQNCG